jgi:hypothetical protein
MKKWKETILSLCLFSLLFSCNSGNYNLDKNTQEDKIQNENLAWQATVNSKSYSKIVEFIIRFPQTEKLDSALNLYFKWTELVELCECTTIEVYSDIPDTILIEHKKVCVRDCRKYIVDYLINHNEPWFDANIRKILSPNGDTLEISGACFEINYLQSDPQSIGPTLIEISEALHDYRDTLALRWFKTESDELLPKNLEFIEANVFKRITFYSWKSTPFHTPPVIEVLQTKTVDE